MSILSQAPLQPSHGRGPNRLLLRASAVFSLLLLLSASSAFAPPATGLGGNAWAAARRGPPPARKRYWRARDFRQDSDESPAVELRLVLESSLPDPPPPPPPHSREEIDGDDGPRRRPGGGRGRGRGGRAGRGGGGGRGGGRGRQQRNQGRGGGRRGRGGGGGGGRSSGRGRGGGRSSGRGGGADGDFEERRSALRARYEMCLSAIKEKDARGEELTQPYCDSVLALCVASDEWDSVLEVLDVMKKSGLSQERSSYDACLCQCLDVGNGAAALEILSAMRSALVEPDAGEVGLVVQAICLQNRFEREMWKKGLALLRETADGAAKRRQVEGSADEKGNAADTVDVDAYNAVLNCMKDEGRWKEALQLLHLMQPPPNKKEGEAGGREESFHAEPNLSTYHAVLGCFVAAGQAEQAVQLLLSMPDRGAKPISYTFELVVTGLLKRQQWRRALQLLDAMDEMEVPQSTKIYNTVISACAKGREVGAAMNLFSKMKKRGIKPDVVTFNALMSVACTTRWKDALSLLDQCQREPGVEPDIITYTNAMRACAKGKKTRRALSLFEVVKDKGIEPDAYCYTAVIDACAKGNMWRKALDLLDEMRKNNIQPNVVTYSVAIAACGNGGQWERALELLNQMRDKGLKINTITYNAAITALAKAARMYSKEASRLTAPQKYQALSAGGELSQDEISRFLGGEVDEVQLWTRALGLLDQMKEDGVVPDTYSYSAAISACGSGGRWEEALELMQVMKKGGPKTRPNRIAYTAAISACGKCGEWEHALELFDDMRKDGLQPDRVAYNALVSGLRVAGQAEKVYEVWREMCGEGQSGSDAIATARADSKFVSPDIITVTDVLATLDRTNKSNREKIELVFNEAVRRGIILPSDSMDTLWEVDMSGMSLPVAHAACHFLVQRAAEAVKKGDCECSDLTLITGVGRKQPRPLGKQSEEGASPYFLSEEEEKEAEVGGQQRGAAPPPKRSFGTTALREYVREILRDDFEPPLYSTIPQYAQGTVQVSKAVLQKYIDAQG